MKQHWISPASEKVISGEMVASRTEILRTSLLPLTLLALAVLAPANAFARTVEFSRTTTFDGVTVTLSGTFTVDTDTQTLVGTVSLKAVNTTSGATIFSKTFDISLSFSTSNSVKFILEIPTIPVALAVSCTVDVAAGPASCMVSGTPDVNRDSRINLDDLLAVHVNQGTSSLAYDLDRSSRVDLDDLLLTYVSQGIPLYS